MRIGLVMQSLYTPGPPSARGTRHDWVVPTIVPAVPLTPEAFAAFGSVVDVGGPDAPLELHRGAPRFWVMELRNRPGTFTRLTRHRAVTQCLAAAGGGTWYLAVAPPDGTAGGPDDVDATPDLGRVTAFAVPGDVILRLHRGTWHAGPFFSTPTMRFFNLELTDTNDVDHHSVDLPDAHVVGGVGEGSAATPLG